MKKQVATILMSFGLLAGLTAQAADLGISVVLESEVAPGVYGRVELGNGSRPEVYYPQPVVIVKDSRYSKYKPVHLHVPPGHAKNWGKHCHKYNACERPVYFIKSVEYEESYQREHDHKKSKGKEKSKNHDKH